MRVRRLLVLALLAATGLTVAVYLLRVERIRVTGLHALSAHDVVRASGVVPGERILWLRLSDAEHGIERIPAVEHAVAQRSLPSTVLIRVRERTPLARLDGARELVTDSHGVVFSPHGLDVPPVLYGWRGRKREGARVDMRSRRVLDAIPRFPEQIGAGARKIVVSPSVVITLLGGTQIRFGSVNDLEAKAQVADAILRAERGHKIEYVDVRSATVPVAKRRAPPTPSPSPSPVVVVPRAPVSTPAVPTPTPNPAPAATPQARGRPGRRSPRP